MVYVQVYRAPAGRWNEMKWFFNVYELNKPNSYTMWQQTGLFVWALSLIHLSTLNWLTLPSREMEVLNVQYFAKKWLSSTVSFVHKLSEIKP